MTNGVGTISSVAGVSQAPVIASAAVSQQASSNYATAAISASPLVHNPRVIQDPAAGFITEYLSANGSQVVSQTPSAITVAYLRLGLTADGLSKQSSTATTA